MKKKVRFLCTECGFISASWIGKCPECFSWNSFEEEIIEDKKKLDINNNTADLKQIKSITLDSNLILKSSVEQINSFFGDGIVSGSVILITGEPGVGKSTFLLYLAKFLDARYKIFYFSGEESAKQIKSRCNRIQFDKDNFYISNSVIIENILSQSEKNKPDLIYIDSIQTCYSNEIDPAPGTISQIRYCTSLLIQFAKKNSIPILLIGHINKTGEIAGPKLLEHMVDVVVHFEGDFQYFFRTLRSKKNRYGSIDELLIFKMKQNGLELVENPSHFFISDDDQENVTGKCKSVIIEGRRPLIIEVEALVVPSIYSNPRRFSEGVEVSRINRIAAILDKHLNENLNNYDIYFNISRGVKTKDVGIDLAIAISIYSSKNKKNINNNDIFIGELSLTGKIRNVFNIDLRLKEVNKFGYQQIYVPKNNDAYNVNIVYDINTAISNLF